MCIGTREEGEGGRRPLQVNTHVRAYGQDWFRQRVTPLVSVVSICSPRGGRGSTAEPAAIAARYPGPRRSRERLWPWWRRSAAMAGLKVAAVIGSFLAWRVGENQSIVRGANQSAFAPPPGSLTSFGSTKTSIRVIIWYRSVVLQRVGDLDPETDRTARLLNQRGHALIAIAAHAVWPPSTRVGNRPWIANRHSRLR